MTIGAEFIPEMYRQLSEFQKRDSFTQHPEVQQSVVNRYLALPGLRGFWPMSSVDYTAANRGIDLSGQGNHLTANNVPLFGYDGLAPYVEFDGVNQYLSRADGGAANWADITGTAVTEPYIAPTQRGLTLGGWWNFDRAIGAFEALMTKDGGAPQRSYTIQRNNTGVIRFLVSQLGAAIVSVDSTEITINTGGWYFIVGRFEPSASLTIFVNDGMDQNLVGVPPSIFDSTAPFGIGAWPSLAAGYTDGKSSMSFLCAAQLSDAIILSLYEQTRAMYGV